MKLISFDPSTKVVGYAIFNGSNLINYGEIYPVGFQSLRDFLFKNNPDVIVIETQYLRFNTKTLISLVEIRVIIETLSRIINSKILRVSPSVWQNKILSLKGKGKIKRKERKALSISIASKKFNIKERISDDTADAINMGLYFLNNLDKEDL